MRDVDDDNAGGGYDGAVSGGAGYDGRVGPGGRPQTRELAELSITKASVGPLDNNAYLLRDRSTGTTLLIDAAAAPRTLLDLCGGKLDLILTTHGHHDHWGALAEVAAATGARTLAHRVDVAELIDVPIDEYVADGDEVRVGDSVLRAVHLVGHTNGSIALIYRDPGTGQAHVFSGDCLFPGGVGNTWGRREAFESLLDGVERKIFDPLGDDTWVYPGHGDDTTLGAERPHLAEWRERGW